MSEPLSLRPEIYGYIRSRYRAAPEYLWARVPNYAVFRHSDNRKWFALVMDIPKSKLGRFDDAIVDVLNLKLSDPLAVDLLAQREGFFPGYHISRSCWVSVLLDGTVPPTEIYALIDESYAVTASTAKKQKSRPPKEWLVPANPKYYDIEHAFDDADTILWKQGAGIKKGDTVFLYVAAPVSAILYKCRVTETDIPYEYADGSLTIQKVMRIRLKKRYKPSRFTFSVLKEEFGIFAVRGPRGVPNALSHALKN